MREFIATEEKAGQKSTMTWPVVFIVSLGKLLPFKISRNKKNHMKSGYQQSLTLHEQLQI
jgi:hypothetical protein